MLFIRANTHFNIHTILVIQYLSVHTSVTLHVPTCTLALALSSFGWCTIYVPTTPLPSTSHLISKGPLTFMGLSYTHGLWWLCTSTLQRLSVSQPPDPPSALASWHRSPGVLCALLEWPCWALPPSAPLVACCISLMRHFHRFSHVKPC